jgi:hypothetical protein
MIPIKRVKRNGKVDLWDCGPSRPLPPDYPAAVDEKLKGADKAVAEVEHEDAVERYKRDLRLYADAKKAHLEWHEVNGGPIKVELWGIDATHALEIDPGRYKLDLPRNVRPGRAQLEAEERAEAEAEAAQRQQAADPQFGQGVAL